MVSACLGHRPASLVRMVRTWRISSPTTSSVGSDAARARDLGGSLRWTLHLFTLHLFLRTFQLRSPNLQIGAVWMIQKAPLLDGKHPERAEIPIKRHPKHGEDWIQTHHPKRPIRKVWNLRWLYTKKTTSTKIPWFFFPPKLPDFPFQSQTGSRWKTCQAAERVRDSAPKPPKRAKPLVPVPPWPRSPRGAMAKKGQRFRTVPVTIFAKGTCGIWNQS